MHNVFAKNQIRSKAYHTIYMGIGRVLISSIGLEPVGG